MKEFYLVYMMIGFDPLANSMYPAQVFQTTKLAARVTIRKINTETNFMVG